MLMTSSTARKEEGGEGGREWVGWDGEGEGEEERNHKVPTTATDHSRGGAPLSRSPRLTVMGDLRRKGNGSVLHVCTHTHTQSCYVTR